MTVLQTQKLEHVTWDRSNDHLHHSCCITKEDETSALIYACIDVSLRDWLNRTEVRNALYTRVIFFHFCVHLILQNFTADALERQDTC